MSSAGNMIRFIIERVSRGKALKRHMKVLGVKVPICVTPDSQLKYLKFGKQGFDRDLIKIAECMLGGKSSVWDIGANVGVFTLAAATVANSGYVLSVEPDAWLATLIRRSALYPQNKNKDIRILSAAISDIDGVASFFIASRGRASNALEEAGGHSQMGGIREKQYVPTLTMDSLLQYFTQPDFVKIDIEGAEFMALKGASRLIREIRPVLYIEISVKTSNDILELFKKNNYCLYEGNSGKSINECSINTLFIPNEKTDEKKKLSNLNK